MAKSKIFLILSLSFILGIFIRSFWNFNPICSYLFSIAGITTASIFYKNKIVLISGLAVLFFVAGIWLTDGRLSAINSLDRAGQSFSGTALIVKEPAPTAFGQNLVVDLDDGLRVLVSANKYPEYAYGDKINLACALQLPKNQDNFDYRMYLAKDNIFYLCQKPKITLLASGQGNNLYAGILKIKNKFNDNINRLIPSPEAGLLSGLILGGSVGLPDDLKTNFSRTGLTHIIAVSGYNVTIVAEYLMLIGIFLGLWRKQAFWFAIFGILIFVIMTGLSASAVRAGVMGMLLLFAMKNGRLANAQNSVLAAAGIMLFFNPLLLRYDVGFQLSFLATLGIIYLYPLFESLVDKKGKIFWLWEITFLSLSAQIFVLPVILYNFQNLSLISLLANVLVLPIIPLTMLLGFLMALCGFILTPLATILAWLTFLPLKYEVEVIQIFGGFKYSALTITDLSGTFVFVWYLILGGIIAKARKQKYSFSHVVEKYDF